MKATPQTKQPLSNMLPNMPIKYTPLRLDPKLYIEETLLVLPSSRRSRIPRKQLVAALKSAPQIPGTSIKTGQQML